MTTQDLYLLTPEMTLAGLAGVIILLDLFFPNKRLLTVVAVLGLVVPLAMTLALLGYLQSVSPEATFLTTGPFGMMTVDHGQMAGLFNTLVVDRFAIFFKFLILAIVALVILASVDYVSKFQRFQAEFYALILLSASGMMLLASTTELISIYVSLELTSLPLAALAAFLRDSRSSEAGLKFLILSAMSSAFLLYGMTLVYGFTGSTELKVIAAVATQGDLPFGSYALLLGGVLIAVGFGFKISMAPFHMWVPDVYEGAPTPITAYLSVASKAAGFAVLLRVFYLAFGDIGRQEDWSILFALLGGLSMIVGNLVAMTQNNIKRMLAYSTVAHAGYILVGLASVAARAPDLEGPGGVLFYLGAYAATNLAAFFAVIVISNKVGSDEIDAFAGVGRSAPAIAAVLTFAMVSLIGIPPTAGFMAKLYIFNAAVRSDLVWLAVVGVINSVLSAYYYLRVVRTMYLSPTESEEPMPSSPPMRLALGVTSAGILVMGIFPGPLFEIAQSAVVTLLPSG